MDGRAEPLFTPEVVASEASSARDSGKCKSSEVEVWEKDVLGQRDALKSCLLLFEQRVEW